MIAFLKVVPLWAWIALAALIGIGVQTYRLQAERSAYAEYVARVEKQAADASELARKTETKRQNDIDQVGQNATNQKAADDARAAALLADADSLRRQNRKLFADRAALDARLARAGKTEYDLTVVLAQLRSEAADTASQLAVALDASRRAGFACEASYNALRAGQ